MTKDEKQSAADLALYKAHLLYWDEKLGLKNYVKRFESAYQAEDATCATNHQERFVTFTIGEDRSNNYTIPELARHEALELLFSDLEDSLTEFLADKPVRRMVHDAIHRLENVIPLPKDGQVQK
jgi:hypothetical protein